MISAPDSFNSINSVYRRGESIQSSEDSEFSQYYSDTEYSLEQDDTSSNTTQSHDSEVRYYEFEIKQLRKFGDEITFLNVKDITGVIRNLQKFKDEAYYNAIENNLSHELMTPLNPIMNSSTSLKKGIIQIFSQMLEGDNSKEGMKQRLSQMI